MRLRRVARLIGPVAVACVLASCSNTVDGRAVDRPPSALALARMVLQQSDLPAGWRPRPAITMNSDPDVQGQIASCAGVRIRGDQLIRRATSSAFTLGSFAADSSASSFKSEAEVRRRVAVLLGANATRCLTDSLRESVKKVNPGDNTIDSLSVQIVKGGAAPNVVATAHAVITLSALGQTTTLYSDTAFISGPFFGAQVAFSGIGQPVPADVQLRLTVAVAERAART